MKVMKRGLFASLAVIAMLAVIVGIVYAFTVGNVDGVWGNIDGVTATPGVNTTGLDVIGGYTTTSEPAIGYPTQADHRYVRSTGICGGDPDGDTTFAQWSSSGTAVWTGLGSHTPGSCTSLTSGLFFSEYVYDSRSGDDYLGIEIYNATGGPVDLSGYSVLLFTGVRSYETVALNGSLPANDVYVLVSQSAAGQTTQEDQTFTNSDEYRAVVLVQEGTGVEGARCNRWATGNGNAPSVLSGWLLNVQNLITNDENQVRYGRDAYDPDDNGWGSLSCQVTNFANQSGFGFDGNNGPVTPVANTPFYLGRFTHYNNQVFSTDDSGQAGTANPFTSVPLTVTVPVTCNDGSTPSPSSFSFTPVFSLDETSNSAGTCVYPGTSVCPDEVTVAMPASAGSFTCPDGDYTVVINGFTTRNAAGGTDCSLSYSNVVSTEFITEEDADNHACLWASITAPTANIAVTKSCQSVNQVPVTFTIVTTNAGPGAAINPTLSDTLPTGFTYNGYTSKLVTNGVPANLGTCAYNTTTRLFTCALNTPLPKQSESSAYWEVVINLTAVTSNQLINTVTVSTITTDPVMSNNTSTATCGTTAVTLLSFDASEIDGEVSLEWETASELNTLGFNIYKSTSAEGEKVKLNDGLLPSNVMPGSLQGAVYTFTAGDAAAGEYYFWLEEVDVSGGTTFYGPAVLIITD